MEGGGNYPWLVVLSALLYLRVEETLTFILYRESGAGVPELHGGTCGRRSSLPHTHWNQVQEPERYCTKTSIYYYCCELLFRRKNNSSWAVWLQNLYSESLCYIASQPWNNKPCPSAWGLFLESASNYILMSLSSSPTPTICTNLLSNSGSRTYLFNWV